MYLSNYSNIHFFSRSLTYFFEWKPGILKKLRPSCLAAERFQLTCAPEILCQKNMASCTHTCDSWPAYDCIKSFKGGTKSSRTSLIFIPTRLERDISDGVRTFCIRGCNGRTHCFPRMENSNLIQRKEQTIRGGVALRNENRLRLYSTLLVSTLKWTRTLIHLTLHPCGFFPTCFQFVTGKFSTKLPLINKKIHRSFANPRPTHQPVA